MIEEWPEMGVASGDHGRGPASFLPGSWRAPTGLQGHRPGDQDRGLPLPLQPL